MAMRVLSIVLWTLGVVVAVPAQQRDVPAPPVVGTGLISGTVTNDAMPAVPVRRAVVTLTDISRGDVRTTVADDRGQFAIEALPDGRFMLSVSKGGYVKSMFGATRPGGLGVALALADAARTTGLAVTIVRGAVITGILRDRAGAPVRNVRVNAGRPGVVINDRRELTESAGGSSETDDRGVYRIYGLWPGEYRVWATAPLWVDAGVTRLTSTEEVRRAQQLIQAGRGGATLPATTASSPEPASGITFADSYYAGTVSPDDARIVRVGAGEERAGIDLTLLLMPTARLTGTVLSTTGGPVPNPRVWIRSEGAGGTRGQFELRVAPDGTFDVPHVMPGTYLIGAEGRGAVDRTQWARLPVSVTGSDQSGLVLQLQPGLTVTGRVVFESGPVPPPSVGGRVIMLFEAGQAILNTIPQATIAPDGSFVVLGVAAGRYRVVLTTANGGRMTMPPGWMLKSITGAGPDVADVPLEVKTDGDAPSLTITLTSRTTELAGSFQDQVGRPVTAFTIVAFSADRLFWASQSRRIQVTRPADDGQFLIKDLPAGDYYVAALTDVDDGQWFDPAFLETLIGAAVRVKILDGQRTVQDLRVSR